MDRHRNGVVDERLVILMPYRVRRAPLEITCESVVERIVGYSLQSTREFSDPDELADAPVQVSNHLDAVMATLLTEC